MHHVRRPAAVLAATVLAIGALTACGDDADDGDTWSSGPTDDSSWASSSSSSSTSSDSSSTSSSSSSTTSAKGDSPEIPEAATKHTKAGATAFAKHYWSETGRALEASTTEHLKELSTDCAPCDDYVQSVEDEAAKGLHANTNPIKITAARLTGETDGKSDEAVFLTVKDAAYTMLDADGAEKESIDAVDYELIVYLDRKPTGWTVVDLFALT